MAVLGDEGGQAPCGRGWQRIPRIFVVATAPIRGAGFLSGGPG